MLIMRVRVCENEREKTCACTTECPRHAMRGGRCCVQQRCVRACVRACVLGACTYTSIIPTTRPELTPENTSATLNCVLFFWTFSVGVEVTMRTGVAQACVCVGHREGGLTLEGRSGGVPCGQETQT